MDTNEPPSGIERLRRELYRREESPEITQRQEELAGVNAHPLITKLDDAKSGEPPVVFGNVMAARLRRRRRITLAAVGVGVILILLIGAVIGTGLYRASRQVKVEQISLGLTAPSEFTSGEEMTYQLTYQNNSRVAWQDVQLIFTPPKGWRHHASQPALQAQGADYSLAIGNLAAGQRGQLTVSGQLIGEQNATITAQALLEIAPANAPSTRLKQTTSVATTIAHLPVEASVEASNDAAGGERVVAVIHVRNVSSVSLEGVYIAPNVPPGMQLASEDPEFSPGFSVVRSRWELAPLEPLADVSRTLILYPEGAAGERRTLEVNVGVKAGEDEFIQRSVTHVITISSLELQIEQLYNGSAEPQTVYPGQTIAGKAVYKNVGTVGLKNVIVEVQFEGPGLDPATLKLKDGAYDPIKKKITWSAATVPALAAVLPQQTAELEYEFHIADIATFPTAGEQTKNFALVTTATVDSPDLPTPAGATRRVSSDRAVLSIGTNFTLQADAFYDDGRLSLTSTGPLPPAVGQETTYTVRLRLGSTLNDVEDTKLVAVLPDGVKFTGQKYLTAGAMDFNERNGEVTWTIPVLEGLTGRSRPAEELHIQVAITPGENQRGQEITFLNKLEVTGTDQFTIQPVTTSLTQNFPTTETAVHGKGKVE